MDRKRNKYSNVMSRVYNTSGSKLDSSSYVRRHENPSSVNITSRPLNSAYSSGVLSELPTVLQDYVPEESVPRRSLVVKPRKTIKSLKLVQSPSLAVKSRLVGVQSARACVKDAIPSVLRDDVGKNVMCQVKQCYSERSLEKLRELKDEISAYRDKDRMDRLQDRLNKTYGVGVEQEKDKVQEPENIPPSTSSPRTQSSRLPLLEMGLTEISKEFGLHLPRRRVGKY